MDMQQVIIIMFLTNTKKAKTNQRQTVNKMGKWINYLFVFCSLSGSQGQFKLRFPDHLLPSHFLQLFLEDAEDSWEI